MLSMQQHEQQHKGLRAMRSVQLHRKQKPAIAAPWALLMVVLLAVVHPALRWTCFLTMPWQAVAHEASANPSVDPAAYHSHHYANGLHHESNDNEAAHELSHEATEK